MTADSTTDGIQWTVVRSENPDRIDDSEEKRSVHGRRSAPRGKSAAGRAANHHGEAHSNTAHRLYDRVEVAVELMEQVGVFAALRELYEVGGAE